MARLELDRLCKTYGDTIVVKDMTLDVSDGEFLVLLGPSGCGKTTTLRMIAGFVPPSGGTIRLGTRDITQLPPWRRDAGLVFQNYALFPHLTVRDNVAFGLQMRKVPNADIAQRVGEALKLVRLETLGERYPRQLSGGQQQRVALARSLAFRPDILLLDEPLSNLDAKLRLDVRVEIRELQRKIGLTTVMVTHDQEEALTMADRLVVMSDGAVRQVGSQKDLYERPIDKFVAGFVGRSNFMNGIVSESGIFKTKGGLVLNCPSSAPLGAASFAIRPERIAIGAESSSLANRFVGTVEFVSYLGAALDIHVALGGGDKVVAQTANRSDGRAPAIGDEVVIGWPTEATRIFPETRPAP